MGVSGRWLSFLVIVVGLGFPAGATAEPPQIRFGTLWYLSAQRIDDADGVTDELLVKRGHLDLFVDISEHLTVRLTPDLTTDADGELHTPVKYANLRWEADRLGRVARPWVAVGRAPTPWIGFAESINRYRMQDGTFMDRLGFFSSSDKGVVLGGFFGAGLPKAFRENVAPRPAGRWGSFAVGAYKGSGFKAPDRNEGAVVEGRVTVRPFPDSLPGLRMSGLVARGEGNSSLAPDWEVDALLASWESHYLVATAEWERNEGVQSGTVVGPDGGAVPGNGWSVFTELREGPGAGWAGFVRHDRHDRDTYSAGGRLKRTIVGVARHFGSGSAVLLDYEVEEREVGPDTERLQLTLQLKMSPRSIASW